MKNTAFKPNHTVYLVFQKIKYYLFTFVDFDQHDHQYEQDKRVQDQDHLDQWAQYQDEYYYEQEHQARVEQEEQDRLPRFHEKVSDRISSIVIR